MSEKSDLGPDVIAVPGCLFADEVKEGQIGQQMTDKKPQACRAGSAPCELSRRVMPGSLPRPSLMFWAACRGSTHVEGCTA